MNGMREKTVITEKNIEEMCILAEDVMHQLYMRFANYDAEGNDIFEKHYRQDAAFSREVRNMMMIFAGQKLNRDHPRYLLLLEADSCHDRDEWMGIYFDDESLQQAYDALTARLEKCRETDKSCRGLHVAIWEFRPRRDYEAQPSEEDDSTPLQKISRIDPKKLRCFRKQQNSSQQ